VVAWGEYIAVALVAYYGSGLGVFVWLVAFRVMGDEALVLLPVELCHGCDCL
jgi:hypothetical protein